MQLVDVSALNALQAPQREAKEMLSLRKLPDGRTEIRINHSSYSLLSLCKRKAHYALERRLSAQHESEALIFGRAVHTALEVWYTAPRTSRSKGSAECDDSVALMESGQAPLPHGSCMRCAAQAAFLKVAEPLRGLEVNSKRSLSNGTHILDAYFDNYADDPFVALQDKLGPICERRVEFVLEDASDARVVFFGTLDMALRNESSGHIVVCDHKTTSALGQDFLQRIDPNFQYINYLAAFRHTWPEHSTRTFMSNGILVAKTKTAFARQFVEIDDARIAEGREALLDVAYDWWARTKNNGPYPMNAPDPCNQWGSCQYRTICTTPVQLRESVIAAQYTDGSHED